MKRTTIFKTTLALTAFFLGGCASTHVTRLPVTQTVDLSGRWNDTDARQVAAEMISDVVKRPWLSQFEAGHHRAPVVIVGPVRNRSSEHINSDVFISELERHLINSGKVKFVASRDERAALREERAGQAGYTDEKTMAAKGKELGADFMLLGDINSVKDETKGKYVILYQVNLELVDLTTNEKVWIGAKEIKKIVTKSKYSL